MRCLSNIGAATPRRRDAADYCSGIIATPDSAAVSLSMRLPRRRWRITAALKYDAVELLMRPMRRGWGRRLMGARLK